MVALVVSGLFMGVPAAAANPTSPPQQDPFYQYAGSTPLQDIAPGVVLKTRTVSYSVVGIPTPIEAVQLLYRSTGELGQPTVNVTSVLLPPAQVGGPKVVSYQSYYDSLNPADEPSYAISGGVTQGGFVPTFESMLMAPELLSGYTIVIPDTEGQQADFLAGPVYGYNTLDSLRAALSSPETGLGGSAPIGLLGDSGGAIATEWAAELAPRYAPDVNTHLVGAAFAGVVVDPDHTLDYVNGSTLWAGPLVPALIGISRAFNVDLTPYLNSHGQQLFASLQNASLDQLLGAYPGLTWSQIASPQYPTVESVPIIATMLNQLIMSTGGTPTIPLFIGEGAGGELDGTQGPPGKGDGVTVTGDVRTLARTYCQSGIPVQYNQYDPLEHNSVGAVWLAQAVPWLNSRFHGAAPPEDCSQIAPGTSIDPIP